MTDDRRPPSLPLASLALALASLAGERKETDAVDR
jgi:hypothetical protein